MSYGAAVTPTSVVTENFGNTTLYKANFGSGKFTDTGMVWTSNIPSVIGYWFQAANSTTQTNEGIDVSLIAAATGQFRFTYGITAKQGDFYVLALT